MIKPGQYILVVTHTKDDVMGEVVYRCDAVGLPPLVPEKDNSPAMKFTMIGGTGPCARKGMVIYDTESNIIANFKLGISKIIPEDIALKFGEPKDPKTSAMLGMEI
jgi:hypothetical protein